MKKQPMKNTLLIGATVLVLAATSVLGTEAENASQRPEGCDACQLYRAGELSFDLFGSGSLGKYSVDHLSTSRIRHNGRLGAGAGLSYFFTRNFGLGAEAYSEDTSGPFIDSASANLIFRLPIGKGGLAPYALAGGGHQFDLNEVSFCQAGGGLEYRFTPRVGIFTDVRMVWPDETKYFAVARLGLRFAF
jgi:hypothetical protein